MLIALDLGTKTGWATVIDGVLNHGMQSFQNSRFSGGGMRFLKFRKFLEDLPKPSQVVYEEVRRHRGTDAAHVYGGMQATLTAWCEENNIPYEAVPVGTIKKFWTGKGNASKDLMISEGKKKGFNVDDDNEMDAIALLNYWLNEEMFK